MFVSQSRAVVKIEVKMLCCLVVAAVGRKPAAAVLRGNAAAKLGGELEHLVDDLDVPWFERGERSDVALRNDDDVHRPVWLGVMKREDVVGLGNALYRHAPG